MADVIDVVNLNADASCLTSRRWMSQLNGGKESVLYQWLQLYVDLDKKVSLGLPGATLADISTYNAESIELIHDNPSIFELVLRPFSHDNALLRTRYGYKRNLEYGIAAVKKLFGQRPKFFLPPEFMCNSEQVALMAESSIKGTFINPVRFSKEIQSRIPSIPYKVVGTMGNTLNCIPFESQLTKSFLDGIHHFNADAWNKSLSDDNLHCSWRDGESAFLLANTVEREKAWLENESESITRRHLSEVDMDYSTVDDQDDAVFRSYPFHSFAPWLKEMRMLGFTNKVQKIEELLEKFPEEKVHHWLMIINSDILSSAEKTSPVIMVKPSADQDPVEVTLWRSERGFEGEEYLNLLKKLGTESYANFLNGNEEPHILKFKARMQFLQRLT